MQPNQSDRWPSGVFTPNAVHTPGSRSALYPGGPSALGNPLLNEIISANNHLFSYYAKPLAEVSKNLLHVTCAPGSLDHNVARMIQQTGKPSGQPHWVAGLAQKLLQPGDSAPFVVSCPFITSTTGDISNVSATSISQFRSQFSESVKTDSKLSAQARVETSETFVDVGAEVFDQYAGPSLIPGEFKNAFRNSLKGIIRGIPGLSDDDPNVKSLREALSADNFENYVDKTFKNDDSSRLKNATIAEFLRDRLCLAGSLAAASQAHGMVITMNNLDLHAGGSDAETGKFGGILWSHIVLFWNWLEAQGIADRVTIVATHEFSRTPWNKQFRTERVVVGGNQIEITSPGRDHHPVNGLYVLNKKIKSGARFGGILDGYAAGGANKLGGAPSKNIAAPTTQQALGSVFFSLFDEFKHTGQPDSARLIREIWPSFKDEDIIKPLRELT